LLERGFMSIKIRARLGRKLLVASVGVASVSYVGHGCSMTSVANLAAPPSCDVQPTDPYCTPTNGQDGGRDAGDAGPADGPGDVTQG
jgi:hypothetical protein